MADDNVRFAVRAGGVEKLLFGVRPYTDGSIGIVLAVNGFTLRNSGETVTDLHFSAHSPRLHDEVGRYGYRMTARLRRELRKGAGSDIILRKQKRKPLIWLIAGSVASLASAKPVNKRRRVVPIMAVDEKSTLVYIIYVSEPAVQLPQIQGFSLVSEVIGIWRVSVYITFSSSPDQVNQVTQLSDRYPPVSESFPCGGCVDGVSFQGIEANVQKFALRLMFLRDGFPEEPDVIKFIKSFNRWPRYQSDDDLEYGEASRIKNPTFIAPRDVEGRIKSAAEYHQQREFENRDFVNRLLAARTSALQRYASIAHPSRLGLIEALIEERKSDDPDVEFIEMPQGTLMRPYQRRHRQEHGRGPENA